MTPSREHAERTGEAETARLRAPVRITVGGLVLTPDISGAAFIEASATLLVADLHLGKAQALAARGIYLPPHDTADTLARLADAMRRHAPTRVICLGDSFHVQGGERALNEGALAQLAALASGRDWIWVTGNHDPASGEGLFGRSVAQWDEGGVMFRHEPRFRAGEAEVAGHLHPCARIVQRGRSLRRRCFLESGGHVVLPAFGALTGSLNVCDAAYHGAASVKGARAHLIGRDAVHAVPAGRLLPD
jgi:hypothetical protein